MRLENRTMVVRRLERSSRHMPTAHHVLSCRLRQKQFFFLCRHVEAWDALGCTEGWTLHQLLHVIFVMISPCGESPKTKSLL